MKSVFKQTATALLAAGGLAASISKTDAALPDNVALHVSTAPLQSLISDMEAFAGSTLKGTPAQMFAIPGMLAMQIPNEAGLPPGMLDMTRSAHVLIANPTDGQKGAAAFVLPVKDVANQKQALETMGFAKGDNDIYSKAGSMKALGFVGADYAVMSKHADDVQAGIALFKTIPNLTAPEKGVLAVFNIKQIMATHGEQLAKEIRSFDPAAKTGQPDPMFALLKPLIQGGGESLIATLNQLELLSLACLPSADGLKSSFTLTPQANSTLQKSAAAAATLTQEPPSLAFLPANAVSGGYINWSSQLNEALEPLFMPLIDGLDASMGEAVNFKDAYLRLKKNSGSAQVNATYVDPVSNMPITLAYAEGIDGAEYRNLVAEIIPGIQTWIDTLMRHADAPIALKLAYLKDAGKTGDLTYDSFSIAIKVNDTATQSAFPPEMRSRLEQFSFQQRITHVGSTLVVVSTQGQGDLTPAVQAALTAIKTRQPGLGAKASFASALTANKGSLAFAGIYLLDTIKMSLSQQADSLGPAAPMMQALAKDLPDSTVPLAFSAKAHSRDGFSLLLDIPSAALSEAALAGFQSYMKMQMQQQMQRPRPVAAQSTPAN